MARSNKLPDGYKSADKLLREFRDKNPKGKITTSAIVSEGIVVVCARVEDDAGGVGSGIADGDLNQEKSSSKAESAAIRRAILALGFASVEADEEAEESDEKEEKSERSERKESRFGKRDDKKDDSGDEEEESEEEDEKEEKSEKPRSRFGSKSSDKGESRKADKEESEDEEAGEEGQSRFKRGARFQR